MLRELADDFWAWRATNHPVSYDDIPRMERPAGWVSNWSPAAIERRRRELDAFSRRHQKIESREWPLSHQVDYRLIGSALARVNWELNITRGQECNPGFYVDQTLGVLFLLLLKPPPFLEARSRGIVSALRSFNETVAQAQTNLAGNAIKPFAIAALEKLVDVRKRLTTVSNELAPLLSGVTVTELHEATDEAAAALERLHDWLNTQLPSMTETTAVGRDAYVDFLHQVALMPYTPEQLLLMGKHEWERSVAFEVCEQTRNHGLPELKLFPDQVAQIEREAAEEENARKFLEAKNILTVPDWVKHYRNLPLPGYVQQLSFMGVADDLTSATRLDEDGISYIKKPSPDLDYFPCPLPKIRAR